MAPIQFIINLLSFTAAAFLIYWTKTGNLKEQIRTLFEHRKLDTAEYQADHFADFTYFYALYVLLLSSLVSVIRFAKKQFNQAVTPDTKIVSSINKTIASSFEHFLIFSSIYIYLFQNKGLGMSVSQLVMMPFLFLIGRVASFVEEVLTQLVSRRFIFTYFGFVLTFFPYFVMIGQVLGYSPLKLF